MNLENIFRVVLPTIILAFVLHRGYYYKANNKSKESIVKEQKEGVAANIAVMLGMIGFASAILYIFKPNWVQFADFTLPIWLRWVGVVLSVIGFILLQWAQNTLGENWSGEPRMLKGQTLITSGPYRSIRHPIYTAFILILGSTLFISSNWLIGLGLGGMAIVEIFSRIKYEEALMIEFFGDQYREYMKRTGMLLPKVL